MMTWMAKKLDIGGYDPTRNLGTRAQGGGGRRAKPLLQSKLGREGLEGIVEMDSTRTLNHLSPKGLVGFEGVCVNYRHPGPGRVWKGGPSHSCCHHFGISRGSRRVFQKRVFYCYLQYFRAREVTHWSGLKPIHLG